MTPSQYASFHQTKIVCTLGPSTDNPTVLRSLLKTGVDIVRINGSHGTPALQLDRLLHARLMAQQFHKPLAILVDLPGPKFRLGSLAVPQKRLSPGDRIRLTSDPRPALSQDLPLRDVWFLKHLKAGESIFLADGSVQLRIERVNAAVAYCEVIVGGVVRTASGLNLPETQLPISLPTPKDKEWITFAIHHKIEWIGLSFVRTATDIERVQQLLQKKSWRPQILAKIEKKQAIDNLDAIVQKADGIMVARGDLGVEMDLATVPFSQKQIIRKAMDYGKPVITATQMLESMVDHANPTRAEVNDIANAILDGTDAVMLSAETAIGKYPIEAVRVLSRVITEAERLYPFAEVLHRLSALGWSELQDAVGLATCRMARDLKAKAILMEPGVAIRPFQISRFRPSIPILLCSKGQKNKLAYTMGWGVQLLHSSPHLHAFLKSARTYMRKKKIAKAGDVVILLSPSTHSYHAGDRLQPFIL